MQSSLETKTNMPKLMKNWEKSQTFFKCFLSTITLLMKFSLTLIAFHKVEKAKKDNIRLLVVGDSFPWSMMQSMAFLKNAIVFFTFWNYTFYWKTWNLDCFFSKSLHFHKKRARTYRQLLQTPIRPLILTFRIGKWHLKSQANFLIEMKSFSMKCFCTI